LVIPPPGGVVPVPLSGVVPSKALDPPLEPPHAETKQHKKLHKINKLNPFFIVPPEYIIFSWKSNLPLPELSAVFSTRKKEKL